MWTKSVATTITSILRKDDIDEEEEDEDSAPLTLPSRFLSSNSNSFSFDSMEPTSPPSQSSANATVIATIDIDSKYISQNCDVTTLVNTNNDVFTKETTKEDRMLPSMTTSSGGTAMDTPKKSNVKSGREMISVPITSLSYDQLVQLHAEMMHPIFSAVKPSSSSPRPSLRHTVLSLTLALTSKVSSYHQSTLLLEEMGNAHSTNERADTTNDGRRTSYAEQPKSSQHWMPRLLLGTRINLQKHTDST